MPKGVDRFHDVSEPNKSIIIRFEDDLRNTDLSSATIDNFIRSLSTHARDIIGFFYWMFIEFNQWDSQDYVSIGITD